MKLDGLIRPLLRANTAPPMPAMAELTPKVRILTRATWTPETSAAVSLSRTATNERPVRDRTMLRMTTNTTTVSTRNTKYFHWSGAREPPGDSRRIGRSITPRGVSCGVVIDRPDPPPVIDENCSMISGNSVATARVTSARYRPLIRSAGRPMATPTTKQITPAAATDGHTGQPRSVIRSAVA